MWFKSRNQCRCGTPQELAEDPIAPVLFDARLNRYHIVGEGVYEGETVKVLLLMEYCFHCGGRMPASKDDHSLTQMDPKEGAALRKLLERVHDVASMRAVLGEPDSVRDYRTNAYIRMRQKALGQEEPPWKKEYTYLSRFDTIGLLVRESEDGSVDFSYGSKWNAEEEAPEPGVAPDANGTGS